VAKDRCTHCVTGPEGVAGHDHLFSYSMGPSEMYFQCRSCGSAWSRRYGPGSTFTWESIHSPSGKDVPGRPGTAPP